MDDSRNPNITGQVVGNEVMLKIYQITQQSMMIKNASIKHIQIFQKLGTQKPRAKSNKSHKAVIKSTNKPVATAGNIAAAVAGGAGATVQREHSKFFRQSQSPFAIRNKRDKSTDQVILSRNGVSLEPSQQPFNMIKNKLLTNNDGSKPANWQNDRLESGNNNHQGSSAQ